MTTTVLGGKVNIELNIVNVRCVADACLIAKKRGNNKVNIIVTNCYKWGVVWASPCNHLDNYMMLGHAHGGGRKGIC